MNTMIDILFVVGLALLFARSKPIILLKRYIGLKEERYDDWNDIKKFIYELSTCMWCISVYLGLIYGLLTTTLIISIKIAVISSLISFIIDENM
jgi:hypothetical protein